MKLYANAVFLVLNSFLVAINAGWVDPDSPTDVQKITSPVNAKTYSLVFSDEFETPGRSFADGSDPRWTAMNKNDYTNAALQYYNEDMVTTTDGKLNISTVHEDISFKAFDSTSASAKMETITKSYQSGMIQGWNKFCFTGGIVTIKAKLPGKYEIGGLWPAVWLLGNLARATYVGSSNNMWPWSYDVCDRQRQASQLISACNVVNHYEMKSKTGRGAPEIDILEVMGGVQNLAASGLKTSTNKPYLSSSLQVSPGIETNRPNTGEPPSKSSWYFEDTYYGPNTSLNIFFYGETLEPSVTEKDLTYVADAISANTNLQPTHFEDFHEYTVDWQPGDEGYIKWYIDGVLVHGIESGTLNVTGSKIPDEPMYLLLNVAMSSRWGFPQPTPAGCAAADGKPCYDCAKTECQCACPANLCNNFPAHMLVEYVRVYQNLDDESHIVSCSPDSKPTATYIRGNQAEYMNDPPQPGEVMPILPVSHGGGKCKTGSDGNICGGGERGACVDGACICDDLYTGPNCLAHVGFDDTIYDNSDDDLNASSPDNFTLPVDLLALLLSFVMGVAGISYYKYQTDKETRGVFRLSGMGRYPSSVQVSSLGDSLRGH